MSKPRKVVITKQRTIHTYSELWHASDCLLDSGVKNPKGAQWQFLSSTMLTAFAFEAYLNHAGSATFACWEQLDHLPPLSKLALLCEKLDLSFLKGRRPLQTVEKLLNFRNTMAHGKSAEIKAPPVMRNTENYHTAFREELLTNWEKLVQTDAFAKRAREDVETVLRKLHEARRDKKENLFTFGPGLYGANLVEEP